MDGFLFDDNTNAMRYWDGTDLPFYWSLANTFPLCDRWFASAPAQTYPNRMYLQAGDLSGPGRDRHGQGVRACRTRRAARSGTSSTRSGSPGATTRWTSPTSRSSRRRSPANRDKIRTFPQFLADCRVGRAAGRLDREPGRRPRTPRRTRRHPARRGVQRVDHQRGHAAVRRGRRRCCSSCTTSTAATTTTSHRRRPIPPDDIAPAVDRDARCRRPRGTSTGSACRRS